MRKSATGLGIVLVTCPSAQEAERLAKGVVENRIAACANVIKDVDSRPAWKRWFTHALDCLMDPGSPVRYWSAEELQGLLEEIGFTVYRHLMVDILPYPHILYVCQRRP